MLFTEICCRVSSEFSGVVNDFERRADPELLADTFEVFLMELLRELCDFKDELLVGLTYGVLDPIKVLGSMVDRVLLPELF